MKWCSPAEQLRISLISLCAMPGVGWSDVKHTVPVKSAVNDTGYRDSLDNYMFPTLRQQFKEDPFVLQDAPVHGVPQRHG